MICPCISVCGVTDNLHPGDADAVYFGLLWRVDALRFAWALRRPYIAGLSFAGAFDALPSDRLLQRRDIAGSFFLETLMPFLPPSSSDVMYFGSHPLRYLRRLVFLWPFKSNLPFCSTGVCSLALGFSGLFVAGHRCVVSSFIILRHQRGRLARPDLLRSPHDGVGTT